MFPYQNYQGYQGYQMYQNPYQSSMYQPKLSGKTVNNFGEITANDVPMDGSVAVFVCNDMSEVQVRSWSPSGSIVINRFKPFENPKPSNLSNESKEGLFEGNMEARDLLNERFDRLENLIKEQINGKYEYVGSVDEQSKTINKPNVVNKSTTKEQPDD